MDENNCNKIAPECMEIDSLDAKLNLGETSRDENKLLRFERNHKNVKGDGNEEMKLEIEFLFKHVLIALAIHFMHAIIGPLSIPLLYLIFGRNRCLNMGFGWHPFYRPEFMGWFWTMMTGLFFALSLERFQIFMSLILATNAIIFIKTLLVSVKYGFYTHEMWELMKSEEVDIEILKHQLILRGWLRIPPKVIVHELLNSFGRLNREPDELCVCFIDEISAEFREAINRAEEGFKIELRHHDKKITHKTNCCIPTIILAKAIIEYSVPRSISRFDRWSCDLFGMMYTATPIASIIFQFGTEALNFSVYEIIYTTYSLLMCWLVSTRFLTYIIVGVVDVKRKMFLMEQCSAFITSRESNNSFLEYYKIPRFDMSDVKTIDSWYTMRTAFIDLGRRYTYRIFIYTSLILPLCVFTIVILILQLFIKVEIINVSALTAVIFLSFSCSLYIVYMLVIGSKVNDMFQRHRDLIVTCSNDALHLRKLEDVIEPEVFQALDLVGDKLDQDERQRPLKILGMKADKILLSKLYALIASGFVSLIQIGITPSGESEKVS